MSEYSDIVRLYPHFVLISEKPKIWYGFLPLKSEKKIKIKLRVPNYPELKDASIQFDGKICFAQSSELKDKIQNKLQSANSLLSFLRQLQGLMETALREKSHKLISDQFFLNNVMLEELNKVLDMQDITIEGNSNLSAIKITYNSVTIILKPDSRRIGYWQLIESQLPELSEWEPFEKHLSSLTEAIKVFKSRVDALESTWDNLTSIDQCCWVIDPMNPKPSHLYRRIHINPSLSLQMKFNPLHSANYPEMKLLGSDKEVFKYTEVLSENLYNWDEEKTIPENIMDLLCIKELPKRPIDRCIDEDAIVDDEECCICFSMESDDGEAPTEICSNHRCRKYFHQSCLLQWLQMVAGKQTCFDRCHGTCPVCKENISCAIKAR